VASSQRLAQVLDPNLVRDIFAIVEEADVDRKLREAMRLSVRVHSVCGAFREGARTVCVIRKEDEPTPKKTSMIRPGRPASWKILAPGELVDRPKLGSARGRYLLLHSVAHIELSAVELALMAVADFPEQPVEYHRAMLDVAREEVIHTRLLLHRLRELGGELGTDPVHLGLFETASTYRDLPARLAVVPRILEARGLDVSERLRDGLERAGDAESAKILERIYRDEIGHVRVGTLWYRAVCQEQGLDGEAYFLEMIDKFRPRRGGIGPIDHAGRRAAGFSERELEGMVATNPTADPQRN
jgi:uncharacterized ferritin-like protein (DUF455 family)